MHWQRINRRCSDFNRHYVRGVAFLQAQEPNMKSRSPRRTAPLIERAHSAIGKMPSRTFLNRELLLLSRDGKVHFLLLLQLLQIWSKTAEKTLLLLQRCAASSQRLGLASFDQCLSSGLSEVSKSARAKARVSSARAPRKTLCSCSATRFVAKALPQFLGPCLRSCFAEYRLSFSQTFSCLYETASIPFFCSGSLIMIQLQG